MDISKLPQTASECEAWLTERGVICEDHSRGMAGGAIMFTFTDGHREGAVHEDKVRAYRVGVYQYLTGRYSYPPGEPREPDTIKFTTLNDPYDVLVNVPDSELIRQP